MSDARQIAAHVAMELVEQGADAVVLGGSVVRGTEHEHSDVDLVALGEGDPYSLRIVEGRLVSVSWRTGDEVRATFDSPPDAGFVVPAWRGAEILLDLRLRARSLQEFAHEWRWARIDAACDDWVADEIAGLAEEVFRLGGLATRDEVGAATMRVVLALRLPLVVSVLGRMLHETEHDLWAAVAADRGGTWAADHRAALGLDADPPAAIAAGARLWLAAAAAAAPVLDGERRTVVDAASEIAATLAGPR